MSKKTRKLRRRLLAGCLLACSLLISGCADQRPIEQQALVIVVGVDINRNNPNLFDFTFGIPLFDESKASFAKLTTTTAANYGAAEDLWQAGSALRVATGKTRLLLFGAEAAARGLPGFVNFVQLARTDNNALVAIARGRAEDMLQGRLVETERIGTNTANLLQTASRQGLTFEPEVNEVVTTYLTAGQDPITPLLELSSGKDVISLVGSALFRDLNMVGEINLQETQLLLAMSGKASEVTFAPALGVTGQLASSLPHIRLLGPKAKLTPRLENGQLKVRVEFSATYNLRNYIAIDDVTDARNNEQITEDLESNLNLAIQQLLAKLQAAQTDPLGIGKKYRVKNNQAYDDNVFRTLWQNAQLETEVKLRFRRAGTNLQSTPKKP